MAEQRGLERYRDWLKKQDKDVSTRTRAFFKDMFLVKDRRENAGIETPPDVVAFRALNDSLDKIDQKLTAVTENTADMPWLSKFVANLFKSGGGEAEKKYPSRKK